jgi:phospholipase/lecithinase/hemolysin
LTEHGFNESLAPLAVGLPFTTASQIEKLMKAGAKDILVMFLRSWSNTPLAATAPSSHQYQVLSQFTILKVI